MKAKVGSIAGLTTVISRPYSVRDRSPVVRRRAAQGIDADLDAGRADGLHVDDVGQVLHVGQDEIDLVDEWPPGSPARKACASRRGCRRAQQLVGPVLDPVRDVGVRRAAVGRVVLEAAVAGGLCDGVMTMPSARPPCAPGCAPGSRARSTGVGVKPSSCWMKVSTPLAASTSRAVRCAGRDRA